MAVFTDGYIQWTNLNNNNKTQKWEWGGGGRGSGVLKKNWEKKKKKLNLKAEKETYFGFFFCPICVRVKAVFMCERELYLTGW